MMLGIPSIPTTHASANEQRPKKPGPERQAPAPPAFVMGRFFPPSLRRSARCCWTRKRVHMPISLPILLRAACSKLPSCRQRACVLVNLSVAGELLCTGEQFREQPGRLSYCRTTSMMQRCGTELGNLQIQERGFGFKVVGFSRLGDPGRGRRGSGVRLENLLPTVPSSVFYRYRRRRG